MRALVGVLRRFPVLVGAGLVAGLACGVYLPFLSNPPLFDDFVFFSGRLFAYYATHPVGLEPRVPPYFSLAIVQVIWGHIEAHRIAGIVFHAACSLALYKLIFDLQRYATQRVGALPVAGLEAHAPAVLCAAVFAVHPVAVYGAGYLIQRTIVLATLFALLSIVLFMRGLMRGSHADAISAGLLYTLAVLSKEHSVLLPAVAVLAVPLVGSDLRFAVRHAAIYWTTCLPAAVFVTLLSKSLIGETYEPYFDGVAAQIEGFGHDIADFPWSLSAVTQAGLFFRYVAFWLWPDTQGMSIDLRVDFLDTWSAGWIVLKLLAFTSWGALGFMLLRRRGRAGLVGFGMLYAWILFLVELSTARFQEPLVLYRSYLWAPGILIALAGLLGYVPIRAMLIAFAFVCPGLTYLAYDRLTTFSSPLLLWEDAAAKLPRQPVPGGSRTLYNLGREYLYREQADRAVETAERCIKEYPATYDCHYARAAIHLHLEQYHDALPHLARAIALRPQYGAARHNLGIALENLGCIKEAKEQYRLAIKLKFFGAAHSLSRLESPGKGLLSPKRKPTAKRAVAGPCPTDVLPAG
jgi:protein O-mannosyl-transferase